MHIFSAGLDKMPRALDKLDKTFFAVCSIKIDQLRVNVYAINNKCHVLNLICLPRFSTKKPSQGWRYKRARFYKRIAAVIVCADVMH